MEMEQKMEQNKEKTKQLLARRLQELARLYNLWAGCPAPSLIPDHKNILQIYGDWRHTNAGQMEWIIKENPLERFIFKLDEYGSSYKVEFHIQWGPSEDIGIRLRAWHEELLRRIYELFRREAQIVKHFRPLQPMPDYRPNESDFIPFSDSEEQISLKAKQALISRLDHLAQLYNRWLSCPHPRQLPANQNLLHYGLTRIHRWKHSAWEPYGISTWIISRGPEWDGPEPMEESFKFYLDEHGSPFKIEFSICWNLLENGADFILRHRSFDLLFRIYELFRRETDIDSQYLKHFEPLEPIMGYQVSPSDFHIFVE